MIRLENILKISLQEVLKTSWRCLEDAFARRLEDVLKMSWRRLGKTSWRCLEDVFKTSWRRIAETNILVLTKTSSEDVRLRRIYSSWSKRLEDVLKTFSEYEDERRLQDVLRTSSSRRMFGGSFRDQLIFFGCNT